MSQSFTPAPLSVVIPTLNAAHALPACLSALAAGAASGLVREVVVADGGSRDATLKIAEAAGARVVRTAPSRGGQLRAGAEAARGDWLLFLHADTVLDRAWPDVVARYIASGRFGGAAFRLRFDDAGRAARFVAFGVALRCRAFKMPYGDQGLVMSRATYEIVGGFDDAPLFEDVAIVRRLLRFGGRNAVTVLPATATTSAERYRRQGWARRVVGNAALMTRYLLGAPPEKLAALYRRADRS